MPESWGLSLTIILVAFDWSPDNKAFDLFMIGHRGDTRSLLGGQYSHVRGSDAWHKKMGIDVCFFRFEREIVTFDDGTVVVER